MFLLFLLAVLTLGSLGVMWIEETAYDFRAEDAS